MHMSVRAGACSLTEGRHTCRLLTLKYLDMTLRHIGRLRKRPYPNTQVMQGTLTHTDTYTHTHSDLTLMNTRLVHITDRTFIKWLNGGSS